MPIASLSWFGLCLHWNPCLCPFCVFFAQSCFSFAPRPPACSAASGGALPLRPCASTFHIGSLQKAVQEKDAAQASQEEQLLQELQESRACQRRLGASVQLLQAEVSELRLRLQSSEDRAEALATQHQQLSGAHCKAQLDTLLLLVHRMVTWSSGERGRLGWHRVCRECGRAGGVSDQCSMVSLLGQPQPCSLG